jgi:sigma-E factor negative regulatory protein RseC
MLEETASVLSVKGGRAVVELVRSEACGSCSAKSMCHPASGESMRMEVDNPLSAAPGNRVTVSLPPEELLKASATAYLMPATAIVAGAAIGWSRTGTDLGSMVGAGAGFALSTLYLLVQGRRKRTVAPYISRIL